MLSAMVGAGTIALFAWLGQFVSGIFEDTSAMLDEARSGKPVSVVKVVNDQDIERLKGFSAEIQALTTETGK
jgi:hypothetical protein